MIRVRSFIWDIFVPRLILITFGTQTFWTAARSRTVKFLKFLDRLTLSLCLLFVKLNAACSCRSIMSREASPAQLNYSANLARVCAARACQIDLTSCKLCKSNIMDQTLARFAPPRRAVELRGVADLRSSVRSTALRASAIHKSS